jgi:protein-disulfide isomerase
LNGNESPPNKTPETKPAQGERRLGKRRLVYGAVALALLAMIGFGFLALRRAHGPSRSPVCESSAVPTFTDELATGIPEPELYDAGPPASSIDEASSRMLAWKPPLANGTPSRGDAKAALSIHANDHCLGSHKAEITLMLFGDLQCPFSLHVLKMLRAWLDERPTAFRLVWRERPLDVHAGSANAALVAERLAARYGESAFWRFIAALSELEHVASDTELSALEASLQSGVARANETTGNSRATAKLERDRLVALTYAIHETPTLFVNGLRLNGEVSHAHLEQLLNEEQQEVDTLLDESAPRDQVYTIRVDANLLDWVRD